MMETPPSDTSCDLVENLESIMEIEGNSIENNFHFSYLTIDPTDEDTYDPLDIPIEFTRTVEFDDNINLDFYELVNLPTLQHLASVSVAIQSWRQIISSEHSTCASYSCLYDFLSEELQYVEELLRDFPVPSFIRDLVRDCLRPVMNEMHQWANDHENVFYKTFEKSDLMFCVWLSEGKIDYLKTALNILENREMGNFERFKIMCKYCLEDEIRKFPLDSIPDRLLRRITFDRDPLQYYWLCCMNDDPDKFRRKIAQSAESFLITADEVNTWSAIEYFWDRLNFDEQRWKAVSLLDFKSQFQRQLFSKMNQVQKYHVLASTPYAIALNFGYEDLYELAFLTWTRFSNEISFIEFFNIISKLLNFSLPDDEEKISWVLKMWNYASDDYKNQSLESYTDEITGMHSFSRWNTESEFMYYNIDFLLVFLSWGSADFRRNTILRCGDELVMFIDRPSIDRLLQLCIPNPDDLVLFEKLLLGSNHVQRHCFSMLEIHYGNLKKLSEFLHHLISKPYDRIKFIDTILLSKNVDDLGLSNDPMKRWYNAIELIEKYFHSSSPAQIMRYQRRIIWSFINYLVLCRYDYKELHKFLQIITRVLDEDLLKRYKNLALRRFQRRYHWIDFDKIKIHQFLLWCLDYDYLEMRKFVKSLSIDSIFKYAWEEVKWDAVFDYKCDCKVVKEKFSKVDEMLLWYFKKGDLVKEYKLKRIFNYRDFRPVMFVKYGNEIDEIFIRNVLPWFFEGDRTEIGRFKELFKDEPVSKLIDDVE